LSYLVGADGPLDHQHCHILSATGDVSNPESLLVVHRIIQDLSLKSLQHMLEQPSGRADLLLRYLAAFARP
jgi:hypothetical protein